MKQSIWGEMFRRKSVEVIKAQSEEEKGPRLKRVLTARDVFNHGVAAIIGTGIFVLTGVAAANTAGPGILLSFVLAGLACAFVSFAYAEQASMIPVSGSAYTYAYATMGEFLAWLIGWDLLLEYAVGASAVASGWSAYLQNILMGLGYQLPAYLSVAPTTLPLGHVGLTLALLLCGIFVTARSFSKGGENASFKTNWPSRLLGFGLIGVAVAFGLDTYGHLTSVDLPAVLIVTFINFWLIKGVSHTAKMTSIFVVVKLAVVIFFIAVGAFHIDTTNYSPFLPFGWSGVLAGAGVVFFAFIGFDAVTTLSEECKDPQKDVPKGVIGSLVVCTLLYVLVAAIMTGAVSYTLLGGAGEGAPMAKVLDHIGLNWASPLVSVGAIAGITSVLIVLLFGQSRIMMRMAKDGLVSPVFGKVSPRFHTPVWSIAIWGVIVALSAGLVPIGELAELTSIGTLFAFVIVSLGVIVLRRTEPDRHRGFKCPGYPYVPILGALLSFILMLSLPGITWLRFVGWMAIGIVVYFAYSRSHSRLTR
ncbi:MAG: amino acid permease [Candidatus Obscuribacterales bacterium]|nr:amino acid permease [Candidatus Obscuribacterales bacterium]